MGVTYTVQITLKPGRAAEFLQLLGPVLDEMRHEATFVNAVVHRDPANPDRFLLYETWTDARDVQQVQMGRAYRQAYWEGLPELLAAPREVATWEPVRADFRAEAGAPA